MSTAIKIVTRAMRLVGVIDATQAPAPHDTQDAIETLNNIGQRWLASGLLTAWTDVTLPTSALVTPVIADDALAYALAAKIAPEYGKELSPAALQQSTEEKKLLWRDRLVETPGDTSVKALILRALRVLNGAGPTGLPDAVSLPGALRTLNAMMEEWESAQFGFTAPTWANLAATNALPDADHEAVALQLAIRLANEYGIAPPEPSVSHGMHLLSRLFSRYSRPGY